MTAFRDGFNLVSGFNFNLCAYFINGGQCEATCEHEALHAWGIPLCMHTEAAGPKCCIPSDHRKHSLKICKMDLSLFQHRQYHLIFTRVITKKKQLNSEQYKHTGLQADHG